ncbi:hypothetical protein ACFOHW_24950 [Paenibacillus abyssi]|uniref:hypothetical protein n=1 Tax=Paenibacillus abyssi TaxID=1340531 RepID=UPI00360868C5
MNIPGRRTKYPDTAVHVPFVLTDPEGIAVNLFNDTDPKVLPMLKWSNVRQVWTGVTKNNRHYLGGRLYSSRRQSRFDEIKRRHPSFREAVREVYPDRFTLLLNVGREVQSMKYVIVQIPKSWLYDGQFASLLEDIRTHCGAPLSYFDEEASHHFQQWAKTIGHGEKYEA